MKKLICVLCVFSIAFSIFCIPANVSAATNDANSFKSGSLVKCGGYYFFCAEKSGEYGYVVYRVNSKGKGKKAIVHATAKAYGSNLLTYKNKLYYYNGNEIICYNPKTDKITTIKKGDYMSTGICKKGIISNTYEKGLCLVGYNKKVKKIASYDYNYLCSNNKYIFYYKVNKAGEKYKTTIKRYNLSKGKSEKASSFTVNCDYDVYLSSQDAHTFKNSVVFTFGRYEGTILNYIGAVYRMKSNGTGVKKILNKSYDSLTPGKNCVYTTLSPSYIYDMSGCYKITSDGKCTKIKNTKGFKYSTENNYFIYSKQLKNTNSFDMYVRKIKGGKSKKVFAAKSFIKKDDPKGTCVQGKGVGAFGSMAIIEIKVFSPEGGIGWRPKLLRSHKYLVDFKTGNKVLLYTYTNNQNF